MRAFLKFTAVFAAILLASAVLAPWLYTFLPYKFERIFNRLVMIFSLAAMLIFLRGKKLRFQDYGLRWSVHSRYLLLAGFLTGLAVLTVFSIVKVAAGQAAWAHPGWMSIVARLTAALGSAFLIAVIEEFFFRGFIFKTFCNWRWHLVLSVLVTSVFYSLVHFVSFEKPFVDSTPTVLDSLRLIAAPIASLFQFSRYWPEAVGLFLFGVVLNLTALRSGSLLASIGLHAGCVFYVKTDDLFLNFYEKNRLLYASGKFYDGILGWVFIVIIGFILWYLIRKQHKESSYV